jgi:hypothetical protein
LDPSQKRIGGPFGVPALQTPRKSLHFMAGNDLLRAVETDLAHRLDAGFWLEQTSSSVKRQPSGEPDGAKAGPETGETESKPDAIRPVKCHEI